LVLLLQYKTLTSKQHNNNIRQNSKVGRGKPKINRSKIGWSVSNDPNPISLTNEMKYTDTALVGGTVSAAGTWIKLTLPANGTGATQRIGDRAAIVKLELNDFYYMSGSANDMLRVIVLQTKGVQTTAPTTASILVGSAPWSPYLYNCRDLVEILHDSQHDMTTSSDKAVGYLRIGISPKIRDLKFTTGTNDVYNGQIYILFLTFNASNISNQGYMRCWFEDSN
jgi:hypothetical protein